MATAEVMEEVEMEEVETGEGDFFQYLPCPTPQASCRHFDDE